MQGDLLIHVPEESRAGKQVVSKAPRPIAIELNPAVKIYRVTVPEASLANQSADYERLCQVLQTEQGLHDLTIDLPALRALPLALRQGRGQLIVSLWQDREIIRAYCGGEPSESDFGRMIIYKAMCDLLWTLWGLIQHSDNNPAEDFWAYSIGRFERCKALMSTAEFDRHVQAVGRRA